MAPLVGKSPASLRRCWFLGSIQSPLGKRSATGRLMARALQRVTQLVLPQNLFMSVRREYYAWRLPVEILDDKATSSIQVAHHATSISSPLATNARAAAQSRRRGLRRAQPGEPGILLELAYTPIPFHTRKLHRWPRANGDRAGSASVRWFRLLIQ